MLMDITQAIATFDKHNIFDSIDIQPSHLRLNFADSMRDDVTREWGTGIQNIVFAGMGGSALVPDLLKDWLVARLSIPMEIVRSYTLPGYINNRSLVIISSYSGNTEEAEEALDAAVKNNAQIVIMAAAGDLVLAAHNKHHLLLELPHVSQPRLSVFAALKALACLFGDMGLAADVDLRRELQGVADKLDIAKTSFNLDISEEKNIALKLARQLIGKPVLVYAGHSISSAAYKWKININESGKQMAFYNVWPELNHNEMQGWFFPEEKGLAYVALTTPYEHARIKKRIEVTHEVLREHGYDPIVVEARGDTPLEALLYLVMLGDYVTAFMGILNGIDPTSVDMIENFKKKLGRP